MARTPIRLVDGLTLELFSANNAYLGQIYVTATGEVAIAGSGGGSMILGDVGSACDLEFEESSRISGQGTNTITVGVSGDTFNLAVSGVIYQINLSTAGSVFIMPVSSAAPGSPVIGQTYYDSDDLIPYVYDGTGWKNYLGYTGTSGVWGGSGTSGYVPYFTGGYSLSKSSIYDGGSGYVGIGTTTPSSLLHLADTTKELFYVKRTDTFDFVQSYMTAISGGAIVGWNNWLPEASTSKGTAFGDILGLINDYFYMGKTNTFNSIYIDLATAKSATGTLSFEYSKGGGSWGTLTVVDNTVGLTVDGTITFTPPNDWVTDSVNSSAQLYFVRIGVASGTFSTEPTLYLVIPGDGSNVLDVFANGGDTLSIFGVDAQGNVRLGVANGNITIPGTIPTGTITTVSATTVTTTGAITASIASTLYGRVNGYLSGAGTAATAAIPIQSSPYFRYQSRSWNGASTYNAMEVFLKPNAEAITTAKMVWTNTTVNGVADYSDLMTLNYDGSLDLLGTTLGTEVFTDPDLDTGATNWTLTGGWQDTTNDFTFVWVSGTTTGTISQTSAKYATALKANTWYKLELTIGVSAPTTTLSYIGTEIATEKVYFGELTTSAPVYFKTNAAPGNFTIYTSATALSNFRIDRMSLKEVSGGNFHATGTGYFGGNVGIGIALPTAQLHLVKADSSALTDFLINPTLKTSGNLVNFQVGGVSKFLVTFAGEGTFAYGCRTPYVDTCTQYIARDANATFECGYGNARTFTFRHYGGADGKRTNTSGSVPFVQITPSYNQASGTAANTDLLISRYEQAVGSGTQLLIDAGTNNGAGVHTSKFKVTNQGEVTGYNYYGANGGGLYTLTTKIMQFGTSYAYFLLPVTSGGIDTQYAMLAATKATATVPNHTFAGDTNTGIGTAGADQLSLIAGGVEGARITTTEFNITKEINIVTYEEDVICYEGEVVFYS